MYYYIDLISKEVKDICSELGHGHNNFSDLENYINLKQEKMVFIGDHYINNDFILDSPQRSIIPAKSEVKILQEKVIELENRIKELETKDIKQLKL